MAARAWICDAAVYNGNIGSPQVQLSHYNRFSKYQEFGDARTLAENGNKKAKTSRFSYGLDFEGIIFSSSQPSWFLPADFKGSKNEKGHHWRCHRFESDGEPTEAGIHKDAMACYNYLTVDRLVPPDNIVIYGHSLGAVVALHLSCSRWTCAV
jgi:hypothetical protein